MKMAPPDPKEGVEGIARYLGALHECVEDLKHANAASFQEARDSRDVVQSSLRKFNYTSIFALVTLLLVMAGLFASFSKGQQRTDDRLANMEAAGVHRDARLDAQDVKLDQLLGIAVANNQTLTKADRVARGRQ